MRHCILSIVALIAAIAWESNAIARPSAEVLSRVVTEVENLDALRSGLAGSFAQTGVPADKSAFQQVCKPVGLRAKKIAEENGWNVAQMAEKYRNPQHQLDAEARRIFNILNDVKSVMGIWVRTEMNGKTGTRYFRRIVVEQTCLACHGPKESRPQFIKDRYPDDKAFDFEAGDLRGLYSIFVPDQ